MEHGHRGTLVGRRGGQEPGRGQGFGRTTGRRAQGQGIHIEPGGLVRGGGEGVGSGPEGDSLGGGTTAPDGKASVGQGRGRRPGHLDAHRTPVDGHQVRVAPPGNKGRCADR